MGLAHRFDPPAHLPDRQLELAEVYRSDPEFVAPRRVYQGLRRAAPDLL